MVIEKKLDKCFFSVIVPVYNKCEFVVSTINSILAQDFTNFEIVAIDDGSNDNSYELLSAIDDYRIRVIRQSNSGVSSARNLGVSLAKGDFVCFLDADDLWAPNHLTQIVKMIGIDSEAIAWATGYTEINFDDNPKFLYKNESYYHNNSIPINHELFLQNWAKYPFFWTGSITVRLKTLQQLQPCFPPAERQGEDQDLWFRLSEIGCIRYFDIKSTAYYRRNVSASLTSTAVLKPLPAIVRLRARSRIKPANEKLAIENLFSIHLLNVAWCNRLSGNSSTSLYYLFQVSPRVNLFYWLRIFLCTLLPLFVVHLLIRKLNRTNA